MSKIRRNVTYWPARTRALASVSDFTLMSMQLWTIAGLARPLLIILLLQTIAAVLFILLVLYPLMGRNYQAAVLSAGFVCFVMGATPAAIANMTAVTRTHGLAPAVFIILPVVAAFFVDVANAFTIRFALTLNHDKFAETPKTRTTPKSDYTDVVMAGAIFDLNASSCCVSVCA